MAVYIFCILSVHLSVDGHPGGFYNLAMMDTTENTGVKEPRRGKLGHMELQLRSLWRLHTLVHPSEEHKGILLPQAAYE